MEDHLARVRRICLGLEGASEKLSHGEPTWFVAKRVFCMFANNHHNDGHVAVWIPLEPGAQATLLHSDPKKYFHPPYVGVSGWIGVELGAVDDEELTEHLRGAWNLIKAKARKKPPTRQRS